MTKIPKRLRKNNSELLVEAVEKGDIEAVRALISVSNPYHCSGKAIFLAARYGHTHILQELINGYGRHTHHHALGEAARHGHVECVKLLLPISEPKNDDSFALRMASAHGYDEIVQVLLPYSDPTSRDSIALIDASQYGHHRCVKLLVEESDVDAQEGMALYHAAKNNHLECVKLIVQSSNASRLMNLSRTDDAFSHAARNGNAEMLEALASVRDPQKFYHVACSIAIQQGYVECVKLLLPTTPLDNDGFAALNRAVEKGSLDVVEMLVPFAQGHHLNEALTFAATSRHLAVLEFLLKQPLCDPKAYNSRALQYACYDAHPHIIDALYPCSEPQKALAEMMNENQHSGYTQDTQQAIEVLQQHMAQHEAQVIASELGERHAKRSIKKM